MSFMSTDTGTPVEDGSGFGFPVVESGFVDDTETDQSLATDADPEETAPVVRPETGEAPPAPEADDDTLPWEAPPEDTPDLEAAAETDEPADGEQPGDAEEEGTTSDEPRMYAGKFSTIEDLERSYHEATAWATRASQENASTRQELAQAVQLIQQMTPIVREKLIEENPELEQQFQMQDAMQAAMRPQQEAQQREAAARQMYAQLEQSVGAFRARHPDLTPNSQLDYAWAQTLQDLGLPPGNPQAMEVGYEATKNPGLKKVLRANPHWMQSQEGLEMARAEAARLFGAPTRTPAQPKKRVQQAHTETGGSGAPADGAPGGGDEAIDRAIAWWGKNRGNPIMGGRI